MTHPNACTCTICAYAQKHPQTGARPCWQRTDDDLQREDDAREAELVNVAGSANQRQRFDAHLLPEEELLALARVTLFTAFETFDRWSQRAVRIEMMNAFRHAGHRGCSKEHLGYEIHELAEANATEWDRLKAITRAASETNQHPWVASCRVVCSSLWVTCSRCQAESMRSSAKVTITWAGRDLVREYAL